MKKCALYSIVLLLMFSCLEHPSEGSTSNENSSESKDLVEVQKKQLIVEVELETSKPDEFTVFCNEIFLNNNQFMNIRIKHILAANETSKTMKFEFPEDIIPDYNLGFLLGTKVEKDINIKKINISFGNTKYEIPNADLPKYFIFNKFINYKEIDGVLEVRKVDGKLNPFISLKRKHLDKLIK